MKQVLLILSSCLIFTIGSCQTNQNMIENLSSIGKVWGIYKYFSPETNIYNVNADSVLIKLFKDFDPITNKDFNEVYSRLLDFDENQLKKYNNTDVSVDSIYKNLSFPADFSLQYEEKIKSLLKCRYDSLFYMDYLYPQGSSLPQNEISYSNYKYPSIEIRLIAIYRYWNWVYYFYPYQHLISESLNQILSNGIISMIEANDSVEYQLSLREIINKIDDAHSWISTDEFFNIYAQSQVPFLLTVINDSLYIRKILITYETQPVCHEAR